MQYGCGTYDMSPLYNIRYTADKESNISRQRGILWGICLFNVFVIFKREVSSKRCHGSSTFGRSMERSRTRSGRIFFGCEKLKCEVNDVYCMKLGIA